MRLDNAEKVEAATRETLPDWEPLIERIYGIDEARVLALANALTETEPEVVATTIANGLIGTQLGLDMV